MILTTGNPFISLIISFSAAAAALSASIYVYAAEANPCSQIRNAQFLCIDCRTVGFCSQINGAWHTAELGKCEGLLYCDEEAKGCSYSQECKLLTPLRNLPPFECQNPGIYPDPYDCMHYHECDADNKLQSHICANGFGYSLTQNTCRLPKQSQECQRQQFECKTVGHTNPWPSEPNIFYVCIPMMWNGETVNVPLLYRCPAGMIFTNNKKCVLAVTNPTSAKPDDAVECRPNSLLAVGNSCHTYRKCGDTTILKCPSGTHFKAESESCVPGSC